MVTYPNLYYLQYFIDAVELGSVSASAKKNLVSHPAVSKAIQNLESQHDIKLIQHRKKNFEVTPEGYRFAQFAQDTILKLSSFESEFKKNYSQEIKGTIKIGVLRTLGSIYLEKIIRIITEAYPGLKIKIHLGTTTHLTEQLLQKDLDIVVTIDRQIIPHIKHEKITTGNFILIQNKNAKSSPEDIAQQIILSEPRPESEICKKSFFNKYKLNMNPNLEIQSWDMICELTDAGLGIGLVPDLLLKKYKNLTRLNTPWYQCKYEIFVSHFTENQNKTKNLVYSLITKTLKELHET